MTTTVLATDALTQSSPRYIIMDAPGYYGDYAQVYSTHAALSDAQRAHRKRKDRMISTDGGWSATHQPGSLIHSKFARAYERLA